MYSGVGWLPGQKATLPFGNIAKSLWWWKGTYFWVNTPLEKQIMEAESQNYIYIKNMQYDPSATDLYVDI